MARLVLVTGSDPGALLRAAAAPLLVEGRPAEPLPIVALRQGGLRDEVYRLASAAGCDGWIGNPLVVFAELPALIAGDRKPLHALERRALLHAAIARVSPTTLPASARRTLVETLDHIFGDLAAEELTPEAFRSALESLHGDAWERGRDGDLVALYAEYRALVAALPAAGGTPRTEGRDAIALAARAVREQPDLVRQRLRRPFDSAATARPLHILGLADLRRGWRVLLDALHGSDVVSEIRIHLLDATPGVGDEAEPLRDWLRRHADSMVSVQSAATDTAVGHVRRTLFAPGTAREPHSDGIRAVAAPDMTRELDHVARTIKRLIVSGQVSPHDIAVIARKARPYLTRAAGTFAAHGVPVHARLRHTLSEIPAAAALVRLFRAAANGWRVKELEALASSPYFGIDLGRDVMRCALAMVQGRGLGAWHAALEDLRATVASLDDDEAELPALRDVDRTIEAFATFAATVASLDDRRTLAEWIALSRSIIGQGGGGGFLGFGDRVAPELHEDAPRELRDATRLDAAAIVHLDDLLGTWAASLVHDPDAHRRVDAGHWAAELEAQLAEAEVTLRVGHTGGVQLLEALSAEGRSFAHVFVLGLESGAFPADAVGDPLFAEDERVRLAAMGIPVEPSSVWLAREATLFRSLVLGARESLQVSWCYADANGAPQLPSAFTEEILSRFADVRGDAMAPMVIEGSAVVPERVEDVWSPGEALRVVASALGEHARMTPEASALLGAAIEDGATRIAAGQMLHAALVEQAREQARARTHAERAERAHAERAERAERAHAWNGDLSDAKSRELLEQRFRERVWSATQLERIGRCGFAFIAGTGLGIRADGDIDPDDADGRDVGSARHVALSRIYPRLDVTLGAGAPDEAKRAGIAAIVHEEVARAIEEQGGGWTRLEGLRRARVQELADELTRYICWEMAAVRGLPPRKPLSTELSFGMGDGGLPAVELRAPDGRGVKLKGQIDRVDAVLVDGQDTGWRYVVDHKSGGGAFAGMKELQPAGAILQLALYLYALDQAGAGSQVWGGTYQLVRARERKGPLERCSVVKKGLNVLGNDTQKRSDETIRDSAALAVRLVETVLDGRLPARTPGATDCLSYCDFRDVCREERMKPKTW